MLSQTIDYALRAVTYLASQDPERCTSDRIAAATCIPRPYLSKLLQGLRRAGIVRSRRGEGGGVTLAKAPAKLNLLEVINAVEPIGRIRQCPLGLVEHGVRLCPLHRRLDETLALVEETLRRTTLAEVLAEPTTRRSLCEFPRSTPAGRQSRGDSDRAGR
jgi:Rrf2 family protein